MIRYRITLTPTDDTGPDTVRDDILRRFLGHYEKLNIDSLSCAVAGPLAAALPKPRIQVRPEVVFRRRDGKRAIGFRRDGGQPMLRFGNGEGWSVVDGLDPDEWTVLLDAEDPS